MRGLYASRGGTWMVRRAVPESLWPRFGREMKASSETTDPDLAMVRRDELFRRWDAEIAAARGSGVNPVATLAEVQAAVARWRVAECALASGVGEELAHPHALPALILRSAPAVRMTIDVGEIRRSRPTLERGLIAEAETYFGARPEASRDVAPAPAVGLLLGRLQSAARERDAWRHVHDFDQRLRGAVEAAGLAAVLTPAVIEEARQTFAQAWLEVLQHQEAERRRAAMVLATWTAMQAGAAGVKVEGSQVGYVAREGDRTLGEVIDHVRREKVRLKPTAEQGEAYVEKNYGHTFRVLKELLGVETPIRAITKDDVREARALFERLPANATKIYPGMSMVEAAERAEFDGRELLAPNTSRGYLVNLSALFNVAIQEGWLEKNPSDGLIPGRRNKIKRRGFWRDELHAVFAGLEEERGSDRWWLLAILAFSGARASEICQLRTSDVKERDGVRYFDLSEFDEAGVRSDDKRLKSSDSERTIPLHPQWTQAGLLDVVDRQRGGGAERLFPSFERHKSGVYSHEVSKWFGRYLDRLGLDAPSLTMHGLRHGFRDAARRAGLATEISDALGGWAASSVGQRYGDRNAVVANAVHMAKIELFGLRLAEPILAVKEAA